MQITPQSSVAPCYVERSCHINSLKGGQEMTVSLPEGETHLLKDGFKLGGQIQLEILSSHVLER